MRPSVTSEPAKVTQERDAETRRKSVELQEKTKEKEPEIQKLAQEQRGKNCTVSVSCIECEFECGYNFRSKLC